MSLKYSALPHSVSSETNKTSVTDRDATMGFDTQSTMQNATFGGPSQQMLNQKMLNQKMLNKVPEITLFFWIIKVLCTTVGETFADFLNMNLHLGLTNTTYLMGGLLVLAMFFQFRSRRYVPSIYWVTVVLLSVFGTLVTDNLTDHFGISLVTTTIAFGVLLALTFIVWDTTEKSLSVHTIFTSRREFFYWSAILFTFALGTAAGDLVAERLHLGYLLSAIIFGSLIAAITIAHWRLKTNGIFAFWLAYILTRPLGASIGDYLPQARSEGGLNLGTVGTSALFLTTILVLVVYLAITKKDIAKISIVST